MPKMGLPGDIARVEAIIEKALDAPFEWFAINGWNVFEGQGNVKDQHNIKTDRYVSGTDTEHSVRLRLDWEFTAEMLVDEDVTLPDAFGGNDPARTDARRTILTFMKQTALGDLTDLALNGDSDNSDDALLKSCEGEYKRKQFLGGAEVVSAMNYAEFKPLKDAVEFTLYLSIKFDFD